MEAPNELRGNYASGNIAPIPESMLQSCKTAVGYPSALRALFPSIS